MFTERDRHLIAFQFSKDKGRLKGALSVDYQNGGSDNWLCCVDTGAMRTIIPRSSWDNGCVSETELREWAADWTQITHVRGVTRAPVLKLPLKISGTDLDTEDEFLVKDCEVVFVLDRDIPIPEVLLGLGGGVFKNGGLCINCAKGDAWLVEVGPVAD